MIFAGLYLLGEVPFTDVIITSTVLAADGRRMSKSLGTGIDPMQPIEAHGADATRYGLLKISSTQDVRYSVGAIEEGRKLATKLWNVARLVLQTTEGVTPEARPATLEERWILARLDAARDEVEAAWERFDFAAATSVLYHVTFDDFCDWYAEAVKRRLYDGDDDARATALRALELLLALLHPLMPHVTEEIWSQLPDREARLVVSPWPEPDDAYAEAAPALDRVREAAQVFRRSGVQVELASEDERRDLRGRRPAGAAPGRRRPRGGAGAPPQGDRARGGDARQRAVRRQRARRGGRGRARQARALPARAGAARLLTGSMAAVRGVAWLEQLTPWPRDGFGLGRMRELLAALGEPQAGLPAVHVVGTNGKSTTTRMVEALLLARRAAHGRVPLAARPLVVGARPRQRGRGRARRAARGRPAARGADRRDPVRGAHRRGVPRLSRRGRRGGGDRGGARRPPRRDERARRRPRRRADERLARPHRGPRRDAGGDRRREARRRPPRLHRRPRRAGVGGGGPGGGRGRGARRARRGLRAGGGRGGGLPRRAGRPALRSPA